MPAKTQRATFEPLPPDLDVQALVDDHEHIHLVERISIDDLEAYDTGTGPIEAAKQFEIVVAKYVIRDGKPLVIEGFNKKLDPWIFSEKWLRDNEGRKEENARNLTHKNYIPLHIDHYLKSLDKLTNQFFDDPNNYKDKSRQRVYLKDIDCPRVWEEKLKDVIPPFLYYLNKTIYAPDDSAPPDSLKRAPVGQAKAGDLMSSLPNEMRAANLMCYIGHEGTYTPAHREMCGSLGQNIMIEASGRYDDAGAVQQPGSSIWFMTETSDRETVAEYWHSVLGHDIETEDHFAQLAAWQKAPFNVYILEQKPGDLLLIPPLAPHQVWNRGTRTTKVAWNRTTVETLQLAFEEALPKARMVCRDEQYKNKSIVYYTLIKYSNLLRQAQNLTAHNNAAWNELYCDSKSRVRQLVRDFRTLLRLFKDILLSEAFALDTREKVEFLQYESNVTCSYCRHNVFNRFLTCKNCADVITPGDDEPYDVCMECYTMGRSCRCQSKLQWVEQWRWRELIQRYDDWVDQLEATPGFSGHQSNPLRFAVERERATKISLAEICQKQLKLRPFYDIKKDKIELLSDESEEEIEVDDNGMIKKPKKKRSGAEYKNSKACHVCCHRHPNWTMAHCTLCEKATCFGALWRAYEILPQTVLEDPEWECPHCRKMCNAGACRKDKRMKPYVPKQTFLGHDTKKVADIRSVEVLVELGKSNQSWLNEELGQGNKKQHRLEYRQSQADDRRRSGVYQPIDESDDDDDQPPEPAQAPGLLAGPQIMYEEGEAFIDPALLSGSTLTQQPYTNDFEYGGSTFNQMDLDPSFSQPPLRKQPPADSFAPIHMYVNPSQGFETQGVETQGGAERSAMAVFAGRKRGNEDSQIRLVEPKVKRRKVQNSEDQEAARTKAQVQFDKEDGRNKLEQARKEGRYIIMRGRLEKLKLRIVLKVDPSELRRLRDKPERVPNPQHTNGVSGTQAQPDMLLQSDIPPPKAVVPVGRPSKPTKVLVRQEDDKTFSTRKRDQERQKKRHRVEEIDIGSDEDEEIAPTSTARPRSERFPRNRDRDDDEQYPDALPDDYKDRGINQRRNRPGPNKRRETLAATLDEHRQTGSKAPRMKPARASTGTMNTDTATHIDDDNEDDDEDVSSQLNANMGQTDAIGIARAAMMIGNENALAKLAAGGLIDEDTFAIAESAINGLGDDDKEEVEEINAVVAKMPVAPMQTADIPKRGRGRPPKAKPAQSNGTAVIPLPPIKANTLAVPKVNNAGKKKLSPAEARAQGKMKVARSAASASAPAGGFSMAVPTKAVATVEISSESSSSEDSSDSESDGD